MPVEFGNDYTGETKTGILWVMGKFLRWALVTVSAGFMAAFLAMLFEPFWSELLQKIGINTADWVQPVMNGFNSLMAIGWFWLIGLVVIGMAIGAWLNWAAMQLDLRQNRANTDAEALENVSIDVAALGQRLVDWCDETFAAVITDDPIDPVVESRLASRALPLMSALRDLGIGAVEVAKADDVSEYLFRYALHWQAIGYFLAGGNLAGAQGAAARSAEILNRPAASNAPQEPQAIEAGKQP